MLPLKELRTKKRAELEDMLLKLRKDYFELRMQHGMGTEVKRHRFPQIRKNIARIKTLLTEDQGK